MKPGAPDKNGVIVPSRAPQNGWARADGAGADLPAAALFALVWDALADLLGTAATATLVRRAARRATPRCLELAELTVVRNELDYEYEVPAVWQDQAAGTPFALVALVEELWPLLVELTGAVAVRHLERIPELRAQGVLPPARQEEEP
jgi:hypothetical protein